MALFCTKIDGPICQVETPTNMPVEDGSARGLAHLWKQHKVSPVWPISGSRAADGLLIEKIDLLTL
jgi:hypothetical protein